MTRKASCCCGAASIEVVGEPTLNGVCHCANCRRRTGTAFGWSTYFLDSQVVGRTGDFAEHRIRDEQVRFFCRACGTTLFWTTAFMPGQTGIAGGAFTDPPLPEPSLSAMPHHKLDWVSLPERWSRASNSGGSGGNQA